MSAEGEAPAPEPAPAPAINPQTRRRMLIAAAIYFCIVFAVGLMLGPIRVIWLEPALGAALAVLCETPFLLAAMGLAARWAPRWAGLSGGWIIYLSVGLLALLFQQIADLAVGFGLRGMTLTDQLAYFATPAGWIYVFTLVMFALTPLIVRIRMPRKKEV